MEQYMNWSYMVRPEYNDKKVVKLFQEQVVTQATRMLEERK